MITLSAKVLRLVAEYQRLVPQYEWCLRICWAPGEVETFRLPDGKMGHTRGIPIGWSVGIELYKSELVGGYTMFVVSGVKIFLDPKAPPRFPFRGGEIDADENDFVLAP